MTREEALNKIRQMSLPKETMDILEALAPELAEAESEDERIRKALIWHLKAGEDFVSNGVTKAECLAYLEKQQESLHIPETSKENANSFTDEDERIRKWLCDYFSSIDKAWIHKDITCIDILRYLEKQKINTEGDFGKGYDCGYQAGYAVAMNEMKPKVATVTLDSEKQKEQKVSVDDFKAKDWYVSKVDGKIHNIYYSVDKVKPKFKVGDKIIEKDFDECGRGTIIDIKDGKYIFDDGGFICIEEQGLWKLVEQKPAEFTHHETNESLKDAVTHQMEDDGDVDDFVRRGIDDIALKYAELGAKWQKEQKPEEKPINWTELTWEDINYLEDLMAKVHYEFRNGIGAESFGKEVLEKFREYKEDEYTDEKEQKSAEWDELQAEFRSINEAFEDGKKEVVDNPERYGLCKSAEWSKEDSNIAEELYGYFYYLQLTSDKEFSPSLSIDEILNWLKFLPERFNLRLKQEWSEEDEKDMAHIIRILDDCYVYGTHDLSKTDRENLVNKLKSLRPQYHGDVTMTEAYKMGLEAGKASSWKPSEEDLMMLEHIIGQYEIGNKNSKVMGYLPRIEELDFLKKVLAKWKN